ncbi:hypothetical protein CHISP_2594 [Chitinispirillum alkaliphilum]|nr:hypothetical protein CHISP_2594 [Chitinispirillum alkaliphilum]
MQKIFHPVLILYLLLFSSTPVLSKTRPFETSPPQRVSNVRSGIDVREFENRMRPFFDQRIRAAGEERKNVAEIPEESDFLLIAQIWDELSPQFRALYESAATIPQDFKRHISPMGRFEIFYTTSGFDSISITDTMSYLSGENWRQPVNTPNGVPDYVDEVAFALDSSWSMMVDRFGFPPPIPIKPDSHPSDRYKVVIRKLPSRFYGLTYVHGRDPESANRGFRSFIEINSDWSDPIWSGPGYDQHPGDAVRITSAHELFHAIQYAMTWDIDSLDGRFMDNFPISWTEGTAVLMEDLAFPNVKDYLQYVNDFFLNPSIPFLDASFFGNIMYSNTLLTKFLTEKVDTSDNLDFIRSIYMNNFNEKISFHQNLSSVAHDFNRNWACILNDFHTQSYFTGQRSDPSLFISDAELMNSWNTGPADAAFTTKTANPYAMQHFRFQPRAYHNDTLVVTVRGESGEYSSSLNPPTWAARAILLKENTHEIVTIPMNESASGDIIIADWLSHQDILIIATNADTAAQKDVAVYFQADTVSYQEGETDYFAAHFPNRSQASVFIEALRPLRGKLSLSSEQSDSLLQRSDQSFTSISGVYDLTFPPIWDEKAEIELSLAVYNHIFSNHRVSSDLANLYFWDDLSETWEQVEAKVSGTPESKVWSSKILRPGYYSVMAPIPTDIETDKQIVVFPNKARVSGDSPIRIQGEGIYQIKIFSIDGSLIVNYVNESTSGHGTIARLSEEGFAWHIQNSSGSEIIPGIYYMIIKRRKNFNSASERFQRKIIILP